jgi:hypothetical protein
MKQMDLIDWLDNKRVEKAVLCGLGGRLLHNNPLIIQPVD